MNLLDVSRITGKEFHPVLPPTLHEPLWSSLTRSEQDEYIQLRKDALTLEVTNRFAHGYRLPVWKLADKQLTELRNDFPNGVIQLCILGANRSSKTSYGVTFAMNQLVNKDGARGWCLQATQATSRADQQLPMFYQIPAEWRPESGRDRGTFKKIVWTQSGGFTEDTFVLPNKSQCWFKFYTMNVSTVEGAELDFAWIDELATPEWLEALRFRLITRAGILLLTFTPVEGYSATVKEFLDNAVTIHEVDAELLPIRDADERVIGFEKVPRLQLSRIKTARVVYFHTKDNCYGNYEAMKTELSGSSKERILMRAYGVATNTIATQFPGWNDMVHIISQNKWRSIEKNGGTRLHFVDPCSGRNWFMIWILIDAMERAFVYREWPSTGHRDAYIPGYGDLGEWAIPGKAADGERGPAQREIGWGLKRYIEEIHRLESRQLIDAESGESPVSARNANIENAAPLSGVLNEENIGDQMSPVGASTSPPSARPFSAVPVLAEPLEELEERNKETKALGTGSHGRRSNRPTSGEARESKRVSDEPCSQSRDSRGGREDIFERWMDSRYGNSTKTATEESTTLIEELTSLGMDFLAAPAEVSISVSARGGGEGLRLVNDALYYNKELPIDFTNQPHLYVVETCPNTIYALKNWTGKDGQHGASKDPVDCLRMFKLCGTTYCDEKMLAPKRSFGR